VPPEHSKNIARQTKHAELIEFPNGMHEDVFLQPGYYAQLSKFLARNNPFGD
jgi:hypothetical protein